jgi:hypothetical protein
MIVLQLPSALSVDNRDYSNDRPRTLQNDSLLRRSILFLRMLIEEIKIATQQRYMEERKARVEVTRELPEAAARRKSQNGPYRSGRAVGDLSCESGGGYALSAGSGRHPGSSHSFHL